VTTLRDTAADWSYVMEDGTKLFGWRVSKHEITPEMIEAGEQAILEKTGGADIGVYFSAAALAVEVFRAMQAARPPEM